MKYSVLCPSRGRPELLSQVLDSLGYDDIEFLVYVDEDDPQLEAYRALDIPHMQLFVGPRYGYVYLEKYYNELASHAKGDWLWLWNDDAMMRDANWRDYINEDPDQPWVYNFGTGDLFPLISRRLYEVQGHFSQGPHLDSWIAGIVDRCHIGIQLTDLEIMHLRDGLGDQTASESGAAYAISGPRHDAKEIQDLLEIDAQKVKDYIRSKVKISLLVPSRRRRAWLDRFYQSAMQTADNPYEVEVVAYIDDDDFDYEPLRYPRLIKIKGPRVVLSEMWNECWRNARGEIFGHMGDDIIFRSQHWDTLVKEAIYSHRGNIAFVWGNDFNPESQRNVFGTHGFVHKNWTNTLGRFVPPYYSSDYNDTHFNDLAKMLNVAHYVHDIWTEHMHFSLGKAEIDATTTERLERHRQDNPEAIYNSPEKRAEREEDARKLREFMKSCD